ncbi:uncharacterized protein LOC131153132 [Malania oleifera]|uniref:uncharacterized protein LOC131153132 n=1 Tax=Malania oleifera TaxID=397392 RepID=UPI0025AE2380|nr:uncharacterized protein LOC131153132 [Malania oleifera]
MVEKKLRKEVTVESITTLLIVSVVAAVVMVLPATSCPPDGRECRNCILDRMRHVCPPACAPALRCLGRCLWGGKSQSYCVKRCECFNGGISQYPKLSDCKKCMLPCKCSCVAY